MGKQQFKLPVSVIRVSDEVLPRIANDAELVEDYMAVLRRYEMPPLLVVSESAESGNPIYWLADGSFRLAAHVKLGATAVPVSIVDGNKEDAIWLACGANARHGLRLGSKERTQAVRLVLGTSAAKKTNQEIADQIGCGVGLVTKIRGVLGQAKAPPTGGRPRDDGKPAAPASPRPVQPPPRKSPVEPRRAEPSRSDPESDLPPVPRASGNGKVSVQEVAAVLTAPRGRPTKGQQAFRSLAAKQDRAGQELPEWCVAIAEESIRLDEACTRLSEWTAAVLKVCQGPAGVLVDVDDLTSLKQDLIVVIQKGRFFAACPQCLKRGSVGTKNCSCQGRGWLNEGAYTTGKRRGLW